jgi:hypothetical protein
VLTISFPDPYGGTPRTPSPTGISIYIKRLPLPNGNESFPSTNSKAVTKEQPPSSPFTAATPPSKKKKRQTTMRRKIPATSLVRRLRYTLCRMQIITGRSYF